MESLVTIAIPTYNRAESYFLQALQSALQQDYPNLEIVVSDNCSTDRTPELVTAFGDKRVKYFRHEPGIGQKKNYNFCVEQARGSYILLLHDDDLVDDDFVSVCMAAVGGTSDVGIIRTGVRIIDAEGRVTQDIPNQAAGLPVDGFFLGWFSGKVPIYCCNTLFNTQKLKELGGFNSKHFCYPDTMAIFLLAAQHPRIDLHDVKASFRVHGNKVGVSRKIPQWCEDSLELLQLMCDLAPESGDKILKNGSRFLARANYSRAAGAASPWARAIATIKVMRYFRYRQLPSYKLISRMLYGTRLYSAARLIKRHA